MYNARKKVLDRTKSIFNRFVAEYEEYGVKVVLEAPTLMGLRMAESVGDHSEYHIINAQNLPEFETTFPVTKHRGAFLDVLESNVLPKHVHVVYADYCGTPLVTNTPIKKNPPLEAKYIHGMLRSNGVALFTFCQRGCRNAQTVAEKMLTRYFAIERLHTYGNMMVFMCVKKGATAQTRKRVEDLFTEIRGLYLRRSKTTISPAEKALVQQHRGKPMSLESRDQIEECEVCLNWFNQHEFFVNKQDNCICRDCWDDMFEHDYTLSETGIVQWTNCPSLAAGITQDFYGTELHSGDGIVYIGSNDGANRGDIGHVDGVCVQVRFTNSVVPCIPAQTVKLSDGFKTAITKKRTEEFPYWLPKATKKECKDALALCMDAELPLEVTKLVLERVYEAPEAGEDERPAKRRRITPTPVVSDSSHDSDDDNDDDSSHDSDDDDDDDSSHDSDDDDDVQSNVSPPLTQIRAKNARKSVEMWYKRYCQLIVWKTEKKDGVTRDVVNKHYENYIRSGEYAREAGIPQPDDPTELQAPERTSRYNPVSLNTELTRLCGQKFKSVQEGNKFLRRWPFKLTE